MGNFNRGDRGGRQFGSGRKFTEMHKATCSECGKICEVPFRPTGERPVFCSFCFDKQGGSDRPDRSSRFGGGERRFERPERPRFEDRQMHDATCTKCGADCQVPFRPTGDKEIFCDACFSDVKRDRPAPSRGGRDSGEVTAQIKILNEKMDKLIALLSPAGVKKEAKKEVEKKEVIEEAVEKPIKEKKAKTASKKVAAKKKK